MEARIEASIREFGFVKPILARELADGTRQILGGEHRAKKAIQMGIDLVPVVLLKNIDDKRAKALGLVDNGRYGEDDALKLSEVLADLGDEYLEVLPFDEQDLAGIFASSSIDLDNLGFSDDDELPGDATLADTPRAAITHELMRFKVPIADRERVEKLITHVVKSKGFSSEQDSMVAAGMALVEIINAAREVL